MKAPSAALLLTLAMTAAACGSKPPDYSSVWSTPATTSSSATAAPSSTDAPQPIVEFLYGHQVVGEQVPLDKLTGITVTLVAPPGWIRPAKTNFSPGTEVIAKAGTDSMATVVVLKLSGNFDVGEALGHANVDAEKSKNFTKLNASTADFDGFPSSMIEGSYDTDSKRLHTYRRVVIPVTPDFQRYLVLFSVTTAADQTVTEAGDVEAIIKSFSVKLK
ncbi:LpqN/LpqT family lipoprotein [Mycolicibacterium vinylchloridicum]|uniref:LpqN/LpqT family lipoprotein n=1 Tax=Mycolicibacterium vinylchloridicum TaxID=2736928 RepID=UPI002D7E72AC|nr:LpqN/LpqT family lipoprotein [Mycolicibacterium vinylchloridicum]